MPFDRLPNAITAPLPEIFHPIPIERPPVYPTGEMIKPILALADYLSPDSRAKRKAAVAKANYEYRLYQPGGIAENQALWKYKTNVLAQRAAYLKIENENLKARGLAPSAAKTDYFRQHNLGAAPAEHDPSLSANYDPNNTMGLDTIPDAVDSVSTDNE